MLNTTEITEIKQLLSSEKNIVITTHKSPDGDAMGSSLALYNYLKLSGHKVKVITQNNYPSFLHWLPGNEYVIVADDKKVKANELINNADIIFCLDFNNLKRIEYLGEWIASSSAIKFMIDHHQQPDNFANYMFSTVNTSSTCELIYDFIEMLGDLRQIDLNIGKCIYTGLVTDTGSFRFKSASALTLQKASHLISLGVDHASIYEKVYDTNTYDRLQLMGYALNHRFVVNKEIGYSYMWLTDAELKKYNYKTGDTEGFVNYGLSIDGVKLSAFFVERDGQIKVSFRCKDPMDVNLLARKHFNGGGHKNAAGGSSNKTIEEVVNDFLTIIPQYKNDLQT
jgi:phosphoesterase RecJ-like protein